MRSLGHVRILSDFQIVSLEKELVQEALQAGAIRYLSKDIFRGELVKAIQAAFAGQFTVAAEAIQHKLTT